LTGLPRLSAATLDQAAPSVLRPAYDRTRATLGVLHFGPGAFHRAHQAWYLDRMLAADPGLAICGVSLRSTELREALTPQDGLYALIEREADPTIRIIGSLKEVLVAPQVPELVFARLADPALRFVTATVTEKGYCLTPSGDLDLDHPEIRGDLADPRAPKGFVGWLVEGLARRRAEGLAPFAVLSCDNLSGNGGRLRAAAVQFAMARGEPGLGAWIEAEAAFPNSMVDSITPATDEATRAQVAAGLGLQDASPVQRERFVQWVVEDRLGAEAAAFAAAGVTLTSDVAAFERAKLRLLNGAHSTLAYVGLRLGHATVAEAMADPVLAGFVERMMREDVVPSLTATDLNVDVYIAQILKRFRNPTIVHKLSQIAWDGSQKLPFRLIETIVEARAAGRPVQRLAVGLAAWMSFVRQQAKAGVDIVDPMSEALAAIGLACDGSANDVSRFLALEDVFPRPLAANAVFRSALARAYEALSGDLPASALND
jgi:fructuronate reductase